MSDRKFVFFGMACSGAEPPDAGSVEFNQLMHLMRSRRSGLAPMLRNPGAANLIFDRLRW